MSIRITRLEPAYSDSRGDIINVLEAPIQHVTLITCNKGAIRGNHYHKKDGHYSYLINGLMEYVQMKLDDKVIEKAIIKAGEMVFTPAGYAHAMKFLEPSMFLALTTRKRDHGLYDEDTVKFELIK